MQLGDGCMHAVAIYPVRICKILSTVAAAAISFALVAIAGRSTLVEGRPAIIYHSRVVVSSSATLRCHSHSPSNGDVEIAGHCLLLVAWSCSLPACLTICIPFRLTVVTCPADV